MDCVVHAMLSMLVGVCKRSHVATPHTATADHRYKFQQCPAAAECVVHAMLPVLVGLRKHGPPAAAHTAVLDHR